MSSSSKSSPEPVISFIVQYFQHPRTLHEICRRLQHPRIEVIIHADSSTSADMVALHGVHADFANIRVIHSENIHELRGYNKAARLARGELLVFSQDDCMPPEVTDWVGATLAVFGTMPQTFAALGLSLGSTKLLDPVSWGPVEKRWRAGSLRPHQMEWRDFVGADQRGDIGGAFCDRLQTTWRRAMAAPNAHQQLSRLPPITFAASLVVGPIVMRRSAFEALGGWNESYSLPGEPGLGMESELVARLWINGWSAAVACPTSQTLWRNSCGGAGTRRTRAARHVRLMRTLRTSRLVSKHLAANAARIEKLVWSHNHELLVGEGAVERRSILRRAWGECVVTCPDVRTAQRAAYASSDPLCSERVPIPASRYFSPPQRGR